MKIKKIRNCGQASLVILLLMAVGMSLGLAVSKEVTTDIEISRKQEESAQAFSAAEAGIESALYSWQTGSDVGEIALEYGTVGVEEIELGEGESEFKFPYTIKSGDFAIIWLADHTTAGAIDFNPATGYQPTRIDLCWNGSAAVEAVLFYQNNAGTHLTKHWALDPNAARREENSFGAPTITCPDLSLDSGRRLNFPGLEKSIFLLVKVYYTDSEVGAQVVPNVGDEVFSSQGRQVTSTGEVSSSADEVVSRRLNVFQTWDMPPFAFLSPLFSNGAAEVN